MWCLLLALPLCGLSTSLVELLGSRHVHRSVVVAGDAGMQGWHDFRRGGHPSGARAAAHSHPDGLFERHHHDLADASVVALDGGGPGESDAASTALVSLVFASTNPAWLPVPDKASPAWPERATASFRSQPGNRLERPPRALA